MEYEEKDRTELSNRSSNRPTNTMRSRGEVLLAKLKPSQTGKRTVPSGIPGHPPQAIQLSGRWNSGPSGSRGCCCGCPACSCSGSPTDNSRLGCSSCRHGSHGSSPYGSSTNKGSNTEARNLQLRTHAPRANAVNDVTRCCNSKSDKSPSR